MDLQAQTSTPARPAVAAAAAYQRLLVPFDGSASSLAGLDEALRLAQACGARICVLHVIDELHGATGFETGIAYASDVIPALRHEAAGLLDTASSRAAASGVPTETRCVASGGHAIAERIVEQARGWHADLIVIGSHGRQGAARLLMGSDAEQVLRSAPVPVMVVKSSTGAG